MSSILILPISEGPELKLIDAQKIGEGKDGWLSIMVYRTGTHYVAHVCIPTREQNVFWAVADKNPTDFIDLLIEKAGGWHDAIKDALRQASVLDIAMDRAYYAKPSTL